MISRLATAVPRRWRRLCQILGYSSNTTRRGDLGPYRFGVADDQAVYVCTVELVWNQAVVNECLVGWRSGFG
ncbi:hypothetical protein P3T36_000946 [Kitasatospora sp. MAP12-15]|nr:hypothetical protein [Kitasatospora sp. MAP12-44]